MFYFGIYVFVYVLFIESMDMLHQQDVQKEPKEAPKLSYTSNIPTPKLSFNKGIFISVGISLRQCKVRNFALLGVLTRNDFFLVFE